jgi:hypothetical protein
MVMMLQGAGRFFGWRFAGLELKRSLELDPI